MAMRRVICPPPAVAMATVWLPPWLPPESALTPSLFLFFFMMDIEVAKVARGFGGS